MKKHLPSAVILSALLLVLCLHAFAAENESFDSGTRTLASSGAGYLFTNLQEPAYTDYTDVIPTVTAARTNGNLRTEPDITVNGVSIGHMTARTTVDGAAYVAVVPVLQTLYPDIVVDLREGRLTAAATGITLHAAAGDAYFQVNERYIYTPGTVIEQNGGLLLPVQALCEALGCSVLGGEESQDLVIRQVEPAVTANTYVEDDLYWLSRAIYAEAGNQSMKGRIAVGTVILNRVEDPSFPNTIEEVIFSPGQFSPVANGTIHREPDQDSLVAAKLCLDGVEEAGDCLYFNVVSMNSWADSARTYYCTIGGHNFYL